MSPKTPDPTDIRGLTHTEAHWRLHAKGINELPATRSRNILAITLEVTREPMFLLVLIAGGALSFLQLTLYLPFLRDIFHFTSLTLYQLALSTATSLCGVLWFALLKLIRRR
ncbi:hypothetical protein NTGHW29_510053 [Candidatus Nitrotoga sp. HW29]|uniref:cation transporting ATPase C-terminal domain-containing protein n=1 Tax=Candidatus Nitrotoga sp. HW29 TaxID=2886963 RepID=UPI001EF26409|nr:cation transporting ATPase C-terminal domain-containing protein [Candidatus Nitrotoga sp. HW29]CAH1905318.1 hypothetical protein NTGHW29_510053 [Candidatus Nitrotoga sp. HW29]